MELINETPYPAQLLVMPDAEGAETLTAVLKATWSFGGAALPPEEQVPLVLADTWHGEPGESSPRLETDLAPFKPATDVVLLGHAHAPGKRARKVDVTLQVGKTTARVRAYGDRRWWVILGLFRFRTRPRAFEKMPLVYERAFGGVQAGKGKGKVVGWEERNPVGIGYVKKPGFALLRALPLPNLESPKQHLRRPGHRPVPAGFGYVARHWSPRRELLGTYDDAWQKERMPLLPEDFDPAGLNGAHPALQITPYLRGDEKVRISGASRGKPIEFRLPGIEPAMSARWLGAWQPLEPALDTVVIEPDEGRVCLTWRARLGIHGRIRKLTAVRMSVEA